MFGLSLSSGFLISTNFATVGVNYNITNNSLSGNFSAMYIDENGWTFNPGVSAMVLPEQTTNFVRGQGFRSNNQVLKRFTANGNYQEALDYFGFEGTYSAKKTEGADYVLIKDKDYYGYTNPTTGKITFGKLAFTSYANLAGTYEKELFTRNRILSGKGPATWDDYGNNSKLIKMKYFPEEALGFRHAFYNQGLYLQSSINWGGQANWYWTQVYGAPLLNYKSWYNFIYKIPRKW